jgi:NAD dependent epimerase/dehydratase
MKELKKVLVTGADGFIGSHLTEALLEKGYIVRALSLYNSFNHWGWLEDVPENNNLEITTGDIRDPELCNELVKDTKLIFHLAALIAIPYSYRSPRNYIDTNITGTLNICQAARDNGNKRVVHISTSEVYGTAQYVPIDEKHAKQPQSPYSASKIGADAVALSFYHSFDLPVIIARPFNTYGPRQSSRAVIPTIITQIASNVKTIKLGDTRPTRDLNFVTDVCEGLIRLAECDKAIGKEINIASGNEISILGLFNRIRIIMNSDAEVVTDNQRIRPESSEVFRLLGDNSLMRSLTHWKPKYSLEEGLQKTCEWYSKPENLNKYKHQIYNI